MGDIGTGGKPSAAPLVQLSPVRHHGQVGRLRHCWGACGWL